jgi:hypothetical protein
MEKHDRSPIEVMTPMQGQSSKPNAEIRQVNVRRWSIISPKPFDDVVATVEEAIGRPNMAAFRTKVSMIAVSGVRNVAAGFAGCGHD